MSKKQFIRQSVIHHSPGSPKEVERVIDQASKRWDVLTKLGFGDAKESTPRETRNHYDELSQFQKVWFDKFWIAFNNKQALQRAAMAWGKLGELPEARYQQIVNAAGAEAAKPRNEKETRKMAEGWLTEYRFDDQTAVKKPVVNNTKLELSNMINELKTLEGFQKATPTPAYERRIEELKVLIDEKRNQ